MNSLTKKTPAQSKSRRVLLVDDDRHLLDSMGGWLAGDQGYVVSLASSIAEAMACVDSEDFDLALVDLENSIEAVCGLLQEGNLTRRAWLHFNDDGLDDFWVPVWPDAPAPPLRTRH